MNRLRDLANFVSRRDRSPHPVTHSDHDLDAPATTLPTTHAPWDTPDVGNKEDAIEAARRFVALGDERAEVKDARDAAIRRLKYDDGMSGPQIATLLGMDKRAVQFILAGTPRSQRP